MKTLNKPSICSKSTTKNFEVIVVNHDSTDKTETILRDFQQNQQHLNVLQLKQVKIGKKELITLA